MKRTYQPSILVQKRRHGYFSRKSNKFGLNILKSRRLKKRKFLTH